MDIKLKNENKAIIDLLVELNVRLNSIDGKLYQLLSLDPAFHEPSDPTLSFEQSRVRYREDLRQALERDHGGE